MTRAEIEKRTDELYRRTPKEFIQARTRLAAELAAEGERARGSLVRDLPKPSSSAWVVNQLWFEQQADFQALLETGKRLRAAQQGVLAGRGAQAMQKAMADERRALSVLLEHARGLLNEAGLGNSAVTLERASTTLKAIARLPDPKFAGRLAHDLELPGLAALVGSSSDEEPKQPAPRSAAAKARPKRPAAKPKAVARAEAGHAATRAALERNRQRAKAALQEATRALKLAERRQAQAEKEERAAKQRLQELDTKLDRLEAERRRLETERARAKRSVDAAANETARLNQDLEAAAVALEEAKLRHAALRNARAS